MPICAAKRAVHKNRRCVLPPPPPRPPLLLPPLWSCNYWLKYQNSAQKHHLPAGWRGVLRPPLWALFRTNEPNGPCAAAKALWHYRAYACEVLSARVGVGECHAHIWQHPAVLAYVYMARVPYTAGSPPPPPPTPGCLTFHQIILHTRNLTRTSQPTDGRATRRVRK